MTDPWQTLLAGVPEGHELFLAGEGHTPRELTPPHLDAIKGREDWKEGWQPLAEIDQLASGIGATILLIADHTRDGSPVMYADLEATELDPADIYPSLQAFVDDVLVVDPSQGRPDDAWIITLHDMAPRPCASE